MEPETWSKPYVPDIEAGEPPVDEPVAEEPTAAEPAPALVLPTSFSITSPAREALEQINLQIPSEYGHLRQAAQACFHALNDRGGNDPTTITASVGAKSASVTVEQSAYTHG